MFSFDTNIGCKGNITSIERYFTTDIDLGGHRVEATIYWETQCKQNGVSLGTMIIAARPTASSSFITCSPFIVGPFLAAGGI